MPTFPCEPSEFIQRDAIPGCSSALRRHFKTVVRYVSIDIQRGDVLTMPVSRPMPSIGERCHELRIGDEGVTWRIIYRLDRDAVVIVAVFAKRTAKMRRVLIETCQRRLRKYDDACKQA